MNEKLTGWFPAHVKPARKGVYQTDASSRYGMQLFQFWNGEHWCGWAQDEWSAEANAQHASSHQSAKWRGLTAPTGKAK